ncbi:hemolysin, partial [cyanobacterium TDX16]
VYDEFDQEAEPIVVTGSSVSVRGDALLDVIDDRFGLRMDRDEVDTVGGLLWHELGRLPEVGDEIVVAPDDLVVRVEAMDGRAVGRASFELPEASR